VSSTPFLEWANAALALVMSIRVTESSKANAGSWWLSSALIWHSLYCSVIDLRIIMILLTVIPASIYSIRCFIFIDANSN